MEKVIYIYDRVRKWLTGMNFALIVLLSYTGKALYYSPSYQEAIVLVSLVFLYSYTLYLDSRKPTKLDLDSHVMARLVNIEAHINALRMEKSLKPKSFWGRSHEQKEPS